MKSFASGIFALSLLCSSISASPLPRAQRESVQKRADQAPAIASDFPDPTLIQIDDNTWYAFSTSSNGHNIQIAKATGSGLDQASWTLLDKDALPNPGLWVDPNQKGIWAPAITKLNSGNYMLYYAAPPAGQTTSAEHYCVGSAESSSIEGPYTASSSSPLFCPLDQGGAIDPAAFHDPQSQDMYVLYKIDGNSLPSGDGATPIMMQQVDPSDGVTPLGGGSVTLLDHDPSIDGPLIEAPAMYYDDQVQRYVLFFSSNVYSSDLYDTSYATSSAVAGPYACSPAPLLTTGTDGLVAPGSVDVTPDGKWMVLHSTQTPQNADGTGLVRYMYSGELSLAGDRQVRNGSSQNQQQQGGIGLQFTLV